MRIDHVLWATDDLDATAERFAREHGLGGGYLELIAVVDADEAAASWIGRAVAGAPEGLIGGAVVVEDAGDAERRRAPRLRRRHPLTIASSSSIRAGVATSRPAPVPGSGSRWRTASPTAVQSISPAAQSHALSPYS
jgi:hypothetical protein